jgi:hypothetical protein
MQATRKPKSLEEAAASCLFSEGFVDKKFELTSKIENILADLGDQVSFANDNKQQIASLQKELEKIVKKQQALEKKYWAEVEKQGFNPKLIAAPAHTALNKVLDSKN